MFYVLGLENKVALACGFQVGDTDILRYTVDTGDDGPKEEKEDTMTYLSEEPIHCKSRSGWFYGYVGTWEATAAQIDLPLVA